jgi:VWFA-related protein
VNRVVFSFAVFSFFAIPQSGAAQSPAQNEPVPIVRSTANEVLLDLVVRDKHGKYVKNLKAEDVEIYEDGVRQDVVGFRASGSKETRTQKSGTQAIKEQQAPAGSPSSRSLRTVNVVCVVFHNLDPVSRTRSIEAVQEFLKNDMTPDTYVGLFVLDDRLKPVYPFSNNRTEVMQAVQKAFSGRVIDFDKASVAVLTANPLAYKITAIVSGQSATILDEVTGGEVARTTITGADISNSTGANAMRGDMVREHTDFSNLSGMRATDSVQTMIEKFGTLPGRKSVLLVSTGLILTGDPDRFDSLLNKAYQAGITFYALDITGLSQDSSAQAANIALGRMASLSTSQTAESKTAGEAREKSRQGDALEDGVRNSDSQASLRALSESTGGFLIANTHEYKKPFQKILDDMDAHYEVSYRPKSTTYDGRLRKIDVKLARADLSVEGRKGYFAMPDLKSSTPPPPYETVALAVLSSNPIPHAFDFSTGSYQFGNSEANNQSVLVYEVPGKSLGATANGQRPTHQMHFSLLSLVKDASGQIVDKYSLDAPFEIPDANLEAIRSGSVTYSHAVSLPAGPYTVETALLDREAARASSSVMKLNVEPASKGIGISNLVLVQRVEPVTGQPDASDPLIYQGKRAVPLMATTLTHDMKPAVYFVVYPDKSNSEKPKILVELLVGGQLAGKQLADLPPPDASGMIPMMVSAVLRPGQCELRMTATQGSELATSSIKYIVPAK